MAIAKLFAGEIVVANPCSNHRQILDHCDAVAPHPFPSVKLHRAPAFSQCFLFASKTGIDQTKHAQCRTVIGLGLDNFLLLRACSRESGLGSSIVLRYTWR